MAREQRKPRREEPAFEKETWKPKTSLAKQVKSGSITHIDQILDQGLSILEPGIVDVLMPSSSTELLLVGQSKGKFGGGQRRVFRQTQKKTREGNKPRFATYCIIGDQDGHVGLGYGKSKETVPAREKATRRAKLNMIKIRRGCGSWQDTAQEPNSIPFKVEGKCGSCKITLLPAARGTGLKIEKECAKMLKIAGIKDIISKTEGKTKTKINLLEACFDALKQLIQVKVQKDQEKIVGMIEGSKEAAQ